ncbi:hypothetical protein VP01_4149g2 [Puccinia sorghi]|uniref:Uncharacterized protein n=1 Tax=Puccinia sorghi TaxID=27349 RepID=A0A0L6UR07_9BASI|nr:hypothetical protein VP01_4149g2 [Puccinia sorghi]
MARRLGCGGADLRPRLITKTIKQMTFYAYLLFVFTTAAVIQAQLLPSSILCAPSNSPPIIREDCRNSTPASCHTDEALSFHLRALIKFPHESNVVFWHDKSNFRSCGTCKVSRSITNQFVAITKPSVPKPKIDAACLHLFIQNLLIRSTLLRVLGDAVTALHQGFDKCQGKVCHTLMKQSLQITVDSNQRHYWHFRTDLGFVGYWYRREVLRRHSFYTTTTLAVSLITSGNISSPISRNTDI